MDSEVNKRAYGSERSNIVPRTMTFILQGTPIPLARTRMSGDHCYDSQKHYKLTTGLALAAQLAGKPLFSGPLSVDFIFHFPMPNRLKGVKAQEKLGKPHIFIPDIDNLIKFYLDSSNTILFKDDCVVARVNASKVYGDPRTEMIITEIL